MHRYPDYYEKFTCIADKCKHNCCIGWEIDIDEDTLSFYENYSGALKDRLKNSISYEDTPHFILTDTERCPFLNDKNLCDIICTLGEEHICDICTEHPRFHNELPGRIESGLGLCCEEACRLIITNKEKTTFITEAKTDDEIIILRDEIITVLQDRAFSISQRIEKMLALCDTEYESKPLKEYSKTLLSLEILEKEWKNILENIDDEKSDDFSLFMNDRQHEYEQFCVYLIYRHFANAPDIEEAQKRARFTAFALDFIYKLGKHIYAKTNNFSVDTQLDIMRQFSSEIEYSDENLHTLFDIV